MTGAHLLTLPATQGGPRPFAQLTCHPVSRLWAPAFGVQACGSAPLTAQAPKCLAAPGGPVGCRHQRISTHKAAGRRGNRRNRGFRTPEREGRSATERGVHRGSAPYAHSLGTFSCERESTSSAGTRPGKPEGLPELFGKRAGFFLLFSREKSRSPFRAKPEPARRANPGGHKKPPRSSGSGVVFIRGLRPCWPCTWRWPR